MAVQQVIENVVKHNEISTESPMEVSIFSDKNYLTVINNINLKLNPKKSTKSGIKNLSDRYSYFTNNKVKIVQTDREFKIELPILYIENNQ
ncbi:MAG: hypothetical protein JXR05_07945 [Flavobacteriaceae bacterium]